MAASRICSIPDCSKKHYSKGFCVAHLRKVEKYGDPYAGGTNLPRGVPCIVDGCSKPSAQSGRCVMHNKRFIRHGSVDGGYFVKGEASAWLESHSSYGDNECLIWPFFVNPNGYGSMSHAGGNIGAHRMMCIKAHGNPPTAMSEAAHSCGNRRCVNPRHLRWATRSENMLDKTKHGTQMIGEKNPQSKLTVETVLEIRSLEGSCSLSQAGKRYGVHLATVHRIWRRKAWAWLEDRHLAAR